MPTCDQSATWPRGPSSAMSQSSEVSCTSCAPTAPAPYARSDDADVPARPVALKEAALAKLKPYERGKRTRFQPNERLLTFLETL